MKIKDYFQGTNTFLRSTEILQKLVDFEALNKKKRYRLKKNATALKKTAAAMRKRTVKKRLTLLSCITGCFSWSAICCCSFLFLLPWMGSGWLL